MKELMQALPHLVIALAVIGAVSALAAINVLTGSEALPVIIAAGGFTLGGTIASSSASAGAAAAASASTLTLASTQAPSPTGVETAASQTAEKTTAN